MAELTSSASVDVKINLVLSEVEARALKELVGYGADAFLRVFYEKLGRSYLEPHEKGVRMLFKTIGTELSQHLARAELARKAFNS